MKAWQLVDIKDYRLCSTQQDNEESQNTVHIFQPELPDTDYIKVKVNKAGITSSDVSAYKGKYGIYPVVPARSAVAQVSESQIPAFKQGQRVYLSPYRALENGNYNIHAVNIDGYAGDFAYVPISEVYSLPDGVSDDEVVFLEDIAIAIKALEKLNLEKGEYIVIYGASYINCILAELAIYYQTIPVMIDSDEDRLAVAQNCGVYYTINTTEENAEQKINEITAAKRADHLIFDTDSFNSIDQLLSYIKPHGKICMIGFNRYIEPINCNLAKVMMNELEVVGVNDGYGEIPSAINMLANKIVHTSDFIESEIDFEDLPQKMKELADKTNYYKTLIKC